MATERIFPFLWLRAGEREKLKEEIDAIRDCGLGAFCVESRVHEDFLGPRWWEDMDEIVRLAKERDMRVWILDDKSYPSGFANGAFADERNAALRARHIRAAAVDVVGPACVKIPVALLEEFDEKLLGIALFRRTKTGIDAEDMLSLPLPRGRFTAAEVPAGSWRCLYFVDTQAGYERPFFCDPLNPLATDLFIRTVYEPHYRRYQEEFGKTLAGFFTDEPRLCNGATFGDAVIADAYHNVLGQFGMAYPWREDFFQTVFGGDLRKLAALWFETEGSAEVRTDYMRAVTDAYAENFCGKLAAWCHAHGVQYAGHIIEDMGAHARLGCSAGHYFKSQAGADYASVDVVLHQIKPYETETPFFAPISGGRADPAFFNYTLAKLASSAAAIDPAKKGALCEIFGAYGWGESVRDMRWLFYHFLSRGVTAFIPHAFSMRENDVDCPPHFYMRGKNPAFGGYRLLFREMAERCELLAGAERIAEVAVLYHAEAEWAGLPYMPVDAVNRVLTQNQIDFDIVPEYALEEMRVEGGLKIGNRSYKKLVVPSGFQSEKTRAALVLLRKNGLLADMGELPLQKLAKTLREDGVRDGALKKSEKNLRVTHWRKNGADLWMLFNEGKKIVKNGFTDGSDFTIEGGGVRFFSDPREKIPAPCKVAGEKIRSFNVSVCDAGDTNYRCVRRVILDFDVNEEEGFEEFCGFIRFERNLELDGNSELIVLYDGEWCEVRIGNEKFCSIDGVCVCNVSGCGKYPLSITLCNSLAYRFDDAFTRFSSVERAVLHDVRLRKI